MKNLNFYLLKAKCITEAKSILLTFIATVASLYSFAITINSSAGGGNWNNAASWNPAQVPTSADDVIISNGNITINVNNAQCANLTINAGRTLTMNGNQAIEVYGNWTNNGTTNFPCCGGNSTVTMKGAGTTIGGSAASNYFNTLVIDPGVGNTVNVGNSSIVIRNGNTLRLQSGIFNIGAGNSVTISEGQSASIDVVNGNFSANGTLNAAQQSGANFYITATSGNVAQIPNIMSTGDGNWRLNITNSNSVRINGTLTVAGSQSNGWQAQGNAPIWGTASTFYIDKGNQPYSPGLEWSANSGTIGVTPGYPNNVTLVTTQSSQNPGNGIYPNVSWTPSGAVGLNGTLRLGNGTTPSRISLYNVTSFSCGGIIVDHNSILISPQTGVPYTNTGNFILQGSTVGTYYSAGATMNMAGSGTTGSPQIISTTDASGVITFAGLTVSNGTYVRLDDDVNITNTLNLTSGYIGTTTTNTLNITNTASTAISGGSSTAYVDGPLNWNFPSSPSGNYVFPVGDLSGGTYLPLTLSGGNSTGGTTVTVEAFQANPGGTHDTTITTMSTTEYWSIATTNPFSGGAQVTAQRPSAVSPYNSLGSSTTSNGRYTAIGGMPNGGSPGIISGGGLSSSSPIFVRMVNAVLNVVRLGGAYAGVNSSCVSTSTGTLIVGGVGGTPLYTFSMTSATTGFTSPAATSHTFTGLAKGSYTVWIKDNNGTGAARSAVLQVLGPVQINGSDQDIDVCAGESATLTATNLLNSSATFSWSPATDLNTTTGATVISTPTADRTYTVTSTIYANNLITNGSFESGMPTGFDDHYDLYVGGAYGTTPDDGGYYTINDRGTDQCTFFTTLPAQDGVNYFIGDANNNASDIFSLNIPGLTAGVQYRFSFWYAEGSNDNDGAIQTTINGSNVGSVAVNNYVSWTQVTYTFTAIGGTNTIRLRNTVSIGSTNGNDFYIDNLELLAPCNVSTTIDITTDCILPVELVDFNAVKQGPGALLTWSTATELNSSHFIIERSTDGITFSPIGSVQAAGNSVDVINYSFTDPYITAGVTYYRLAQYDFDGTVHYSYVRVVSKEEIADVHISPNPNNGNFVVSFGTEGDYRITVVNSLGQIVFADNSYETSTIRKVDITYLAAGVYYVQVSTGTDMIVKKIVKE